MVTHSLLALSKRQKTIKRNNFTYQETQALQQLCRAFLVKKYHVVPFTLSVFDSIFAKKRLLFRSLITANTMQFRAKCVRGFLMLSFTKKKLDVNQLIDIFHKTKQMNYFKIRTIRFRLIFI